MEAHRISVLKTARYFTLGSAKSPVSNVWFVCHGYRQLANHFLQKFSALDDGQTLVVAPEGYHRFYLEGYHGRVGASWMTSEDRLTDIGDYIAYLNHLYDRITDPLRGTDYKVTVLGFSQGTATASRWVSAGNKRVDNLVLWAGRFAEDVVDEQIAFNVQPLGLHTVAGASDEFITQEDLDTHRQWLESKGLQPKHHSFEGPHTINSDALKVLASSL